MKKLIKAFLNKETILYLVFGVLTTAVSFVTLKLFDVVLGKELYLVSNSLSWILSVAFAYVTNKPFVFQSNDWSMKTVVPEFLKFVGSRLSSLAVETLIILIAVDICKLDSVIIKLVASVLVVIMNYITSKFLVFKKDR